MRNWIFLLLFSAFLAGCQEPAPPAATEPAAAPATSEAAPPETTEFTLKGQVVSVDAAQKSATINHEKIEGFMEAMTMPYPVPEDGDLQKLKPGETITAKVSYIRAESKYWLTNVEVEPK